MYFVYSICCKQLTICREAQTHQLLQVMPLCDPCLLTTIIIMIILKVFTQSCSMRHHSILLYHRKNTDSLGFNCVSDSKSIKYSIVRKRKSVHCKVLYVVHFYIDFLRDKKLVVSTPFPVIHKFYCPQKFKMAISYRKQVKI